MGLSRSIFDLENGVFLSSPILWFQILDLKNQKFWLLTKSQLQTWNLRFWWESTWKKIYCDFSSYRLEKFPSWGGGQDGENRVFDGQITPPFFIVPPHFLFDLKNTRYIFQEPKK